MIFDAPAFLSILLPWKYLYLQGIHMSYCRRGCLLLNGVLLKRVFQAGVRFRNIRHFHLVISSDAEKQQDLLFCHTKEEQKRQTTFTITILRLQNINLSVFVSNPHFSSLKQTGFIRMTASVHSFTITAHISVQYNE